MAIALSASDRSFSAQSAASGSTPTLGNVAVLDATPTPSPRPEGVLNNGAEAEYGSNDSALSHLGSSSNASQGRRISDARPRVPRLETDAAALSQGRAQQQQQAPLILAHSASTQASSASSSRNGAFFGTPNDVASSSSSSTAAFQPHGRQTSGSSTLSAAPASQAALGHSSSSFSISSMDSVPSESGLARQGSVGRSASTSSRWAAATSGGGFGSSLQTPSSGVELHSASSIRSRRNWDEFEGKPITPLPSPSMYARERNGSLGPFDASFAKEGVKREDEALLPSEGRAKASSSVLASAAAAAEEAPAPGTPSSKTLAFFGAPRSPLPAPSSRNASATFPAPAPRVASNGSSSTDAPAEAASSSSNGGWLSRTNAALNGVSNGSSNVGAQGASPLESNFASAGALNAARLHQPTRLPTLPSSSASSSGLPPSSSGGHGWLESSFTSSTSQPSPTNTSAFFNTSTSSTSTNGGGVGVGVANEERLSSLPSAVMNGGAHRSSPLRPQLGSSTAEAAASSLATTATTTTTTTTLMDEVPAARRRGSTTTRHTHGPSENATGSSFLPRESSPSHPTTSRPAASATAAVAAAPTRGTQLGNAPDEEVDEDLDEGRVGVWKIERTLGVGAFSRVVLARRIDAGASTATTSVGATKTNGLRRMLQSTMAHCSPKLSAAAKEEEKTKTAAAAGEQEEAKDEVVALKMMEREPCSLNERMRVSWVREVEVLKHISHPNIVRFIDSFSTLRHHTLVLETVSGGELFELLANHQPELARREWLVRRLFGELAHAVGWMHSINLVHRDIKLENIILTRDIFASPLRPSTLPSVPLVKVTDFGLSRFVDPDAPLLETRCGSEEYAAPELIIGKRYDGRKTDVWALGVVLYALLTGSLPFLEDSSSVGSTAAREGEAGRDARERKAHLLRIAKGDLRWPAASNDDAKDQPAPAECPASNRLITPAAKYLTARLLRRDATKRALAWDVWDDAWMREGSFSTEGESSAEGETFEVPLDPRSERGQAWLAENARVIGGLAEVAAAD